MATMILCLVVSLSFFYMLNVATLKVVLVKCDLLRLVFGGLDWPYQFLPAGWRTDYLYDKLLI